MTPEEIDELAKSLHHEWDSPGLWARIVRPRWALRLGIFGLAAALLVGIYFVIPSRRSVAPSPLLTEQAMAEVEKAEAAYLQSIDRLARVAAPKLDQPATPLMKAYAEKLALLDGAIAGLRREVDRNGFNAHLHVQMAAVYRDKQKTLEEVVRHE
jgi:hypothetical protein